MVKKLKIVRPDAKGRVTLRHLAHGVSRLEIPAKEKWLFENKAARNQVKRGLEDSAAGRVKSRSRT